LRFLFFVVSAWSHRYSNDLFFIWRYRCHRNIKIDILFKLVLNFICKLLVKLITIPIKWRFLLNIFLFLLNNFLFKYFPFALWVSKSTFLAFLLFFLKFVLFLLFYLCLWFKKFFFKIRKSILLIILRSLWIILLIISKFLIYIRRFWCLLKSIKVIFVIFIRTFFIFHLRINIFGNKF